MTKQNSRQGKFKSDALRLTEGPHLAGYAIQHSERHLSFAALEQCLFLRFLDCNPRSALIRHMRRIRPKLWPLGLDILSITGYGYMLHATRQELATVQALE